MDRYHDYCCHVCATVCWRCHTKRLYFRFLGTFIGCLFAALALVFLGHTNLAIMLAIGVSSFMFSYIATGKENLIQTGTLGAVTTAIIMLAKTSTLTIAMQRFFEISIGILIATLVSQFVLPIHARTHLRRAQAATLRQLLDYYIKLMIDYYQKKCADNYKEMDEDIVKGLLKQRPWLGKRF